MKTAHQTNTIPPIRVLLVEDHPAVRVGARRLVEEQPDMALVAEAASAEDALRQLQGPELDVDVALVDYQLGAGGDGLALTTALKELDQPPRVLIYSAFADIALLAPAIVAGADGLLRKDAMGEELCIAIRRLAKGRRYLPAVKSSVIRAMAVRLEPDDQAIFAMLVHGTTADVVAERLRLTEPELTQRRLRILRSLKRTPSGVLAKARSPLNYERAQRRANRWAA